MHTRGLNEQASSLCSSKESEGMLCCPQPWGQGVSSSSEEKKEWREAGAGVNDGLAQGFAMEKCVKLGREERMDNWKD